MEEGDCAEDGLLNTKSYICKKGDQDSSHTNNSHFSCMDGAEDKTPNLNLTRPVLHPDAAVKPGIQHPLWYDTMGSSSNDLVFTLILYAYLLLHSYYSMVITPSTNAQPQS